MTSKELAVKLNGREYRDELTDKESEQAARDGLVVVYGASDDLIEFSGAIYDEAGCGGGGDIYVTKEGLLEHHSDCECNYCGFDEAKKKAKLIEALWCAEDDYSWTYKTKIPHETFEIVEDGRPYCRGFVFSIKDL